ncbi:hypothetical protein N7451_012316 [Penicillium sp. IBT 35674x]|nr:hypothetical protein N7451_012316 [Penicillium sp. IBT 35674x]
MSSTQQKRDPEIWQVFPVTAKPESNDVTSQAPGRTKANSPPELTTTFLNRTRFRKGHSALEISG